MKQRYENRPHNCMRPISFTYNIFPAADGSVLFELGKTKVLIAVTMQPGVPPFLRGKKTGWLTAEYALLPASTRPRTQREHGNRNGRSVEISRLIGRSLRAVAKLDGFGERTIQIDCDVLSADGGTRVAALNGAFLALRAAEQVWLQNGIIQTPVITNELMAMSVGVMSDSLLLDIDYSEDIEVLADVTLVVTRQGDILEIQGAAERGPIPWGAYAELRTMATAGIEQLSPVFDGQQKKDSAQASTGGLELCL